MAVLNGYHDTELLWWTAADFSSRQEAISKERVENSGSWLLKSETYQSWLNSTASNFLCYKGIRN